jgi:hypothetical protein
MQPILVLKTLSIRHKDYYSRSLDATKPLIYEGQVEFVSDTGEVKFNLDGDLSKRVLAVVSEVMAESTRKLANNLTAEVVAGTPLLPSSL